MSKNPFLDLGFAPDEAAAMHIREQLAATLEHYIASKGWSQIQAAKALKVPQPTISKVVNGNTDRLSIEFLVKLLVRAGLPVGVAGSRIAVGRPSTRRRTDERRVSA